MNCFLLQCAAGSDRALFFSASATDPAVARIFRDERGVAIIELALVAPILALLTIGVVDMSNAYSRKLSVEQGAQRAIEKIMQTTGDNTVGDTLKTEAVCQVNGTDNAGVCKTTPITNADVTVTYTQECNAAGVVTKTSSDDADAFDLLPDCPSGSTTAKYIQVTVNDKYTPMFPVRFAGIQSDGKYHIRAIAGMRIQ